MKERFDNFREYEAAILGAELGEPPEIDLHGALDTVDGVQAALQFVDQQFMADERVVRIIHGRGRGHMREDVQRALADCELVEYFRDSSKPGEIMGVTYVVLAEK